MDDLEMDLARFEDDGAGSAITSMPDQPCCSLHDPFCGQGPKRYEGYPCAQEYAVQVS